MQRYFARVDEEFFQFCDKELAKINTFFAGNLLFSINSGLDNLKMRICWLKEKLAEAQRKFESLKTDLNDWTWALSSSTPGISKEKKQQSNLPFQIDEEDDDNEEEIESPKVERIKLSNLDVKSVERDSASNRVGLYKRKSLNELDLDADLIEKEKQEDRKVIALAKRFKEKHRERRLKQKQVRKINDLKLAYSEFYLSLILLQNYQTLNFTGFRKILKKHDKIFKTDRGSDWHKLNVEAAPFNTTKKVDTLIAEVENLFTQYLENGDKTRAMKRLHVPPFEEKVVF